MSEAIVKAHVTAPAVIAAWNNKDIASLLSLYAPDCKVEDIGLAKPLYGHEGVRRVYLYTVAGFSDLSFTLTRSVETESQTIFEWECCGKQVRRVLGVPPTGRELHMTGVTWLTLRDGLIESSRRVWDMAGLLRQMGLLPDLPVI
jgi:steroid delta-isomerase-like uncharacterized protein